MGTRQRDVAGRGGGGSIQGRWVNTRADNAEKMRHVSATKLLYPSKHSREVELDGIARLISISEISELPVQAE